MRVRELIDELKKSADMDAIVVLSRDSEGNGYSELFQIDVSMKFDAKDGEVYPRNDRGAPRTTVPAVVLWP